MLGIKWTIGIYSEYGTEYLSKNSKDTEYYLSEYIGEDTMIWHEPNSLFPLKEGLSWLPIVIKVS